VAGSGASDATHRPRFATSALVTYATSLTVAFVSLLNVLITARYLGPTGRGQVAFVQAIAGFTSTVGLLGIEQANVNLAGTQPAWRRALATNSLILAALLGGCCVAVVGLLAATVPAVGRGLPPGLLALALAAIPMLIARTYLVSLLDGDYRFWVSNTAALLSPLSGVVVNGALAVAGLLTAASASVTWVAGQTAGMLLLAWFVARRSVGFGRPDRRVARRALAFGSKAHIGRVANLGNYRLDQWLVGAIAGPRELGLYSVAVAWSEVLFYVPTTLARVQRPDIVRATPRVAARRVAAVFRVAMLLTLPGALVLILGAPVLCSGFFGPRFTEAAPALRVLALGAFGVVAVKLLGDALTAQRRPLLSSAAIGVGFVFTVALDLLLIPQHGGFGAAVASTIAYSAAGITAATMFVRVLRGNPRDLRPRAADLPALVGKLRALLARG
jgi:O-antigen/teichoic acid export membrane protein